MEEPRGKELVVTKKVKGLIKEFEEIEWTQSLSIDIGFALKAVRCNGVEELNTVIDIIHEMDGLEISDNSKGFSYEHELKKCERAVRHNISLINKIRKEIGKLKVCPRCKGRKHEKGKHRNGVGEKDEGYWKDCERCNGRGIVD